MRNRYFRAELWGMLRESENRRFVELEMAANVAAYVLTTCLKNKVTLSADEILLCKTIIELSRQEREARGRRARARKKKRKAGDPDRPLCHPRGLGRRAGALR